MSKLDKVKEVIKENFRLAECGIFNTRNIMGDFMETIYEEDGVTVDICRGWEYFEVFGLSNPEFAELKDFYDTLSKGRSGGMK